jgi:SAM-dependent methyltransferase
MPANAYREDLAYIHDAAYSLSKSSSGADYENGTVVDLGCGSGVLAGIVARAGYRVIGSDISDAMVAIARRRVPEAEFHVSSFISAAIPVSIAVTAIGEVLSYAFDARNGPQAANDFFRRAYEALAPGGLQLFDIAGSERTAASRRTFAEGPDWAVLVNSQLDESQRVLTRHITSFRQVGTLYRRDTEKHRLMLLDPMEVLRSLRSVGFQAQRIPGYSADPMPEGIAAFLAWKAVSDSV